MGIYFGSHTASINNLDDYEEGTWTPDWHGNNGGTTSHNFDHGTYVKIGDMVHLSMYAHQSHSGSNGPYQSFAPFANRNHNGATCFNALMTDSMDSGSSANFWGIYFQKNSTTMYIYYVTKNQGWTYQETGHDNNFTLIGNITYESA